MIDDVICPAIIGTDDVGAGLTWPSHGKGAPSGRMGYGERAFVSSSVIFVTTSLGFVMSSPETSSLMTERFVGSVFSLGFPFAVRMMDFRAVFGFFTNSLSKNLPYLRRRMLRACFRRSLIVFRRPLKHA